ncbi:hypothetical protein ACS0TY_005902 [Phlomoides rotata]
MNQGNPKIEKDEILDLGKVGVIDTRKLKSNPICLVGKVCVEKAINSFALIDVMYKAFRAKGKLTARDWGHGLVIFSFDCEVDREWVIQNQPWHFDNALFAILPLTGKE